MTPHHSTRVVETLVWDGRTVEVRYDPDWCSLSELAPGRQLAHLELQVTTPALAPLPVTDTGYRSHFVPVGAVEDAGGPVAFVRAWLDVEASRPMWRRAETAWRQLDLFR
jgi:hypothetical protein